MKQKSLSENPSNTQQLNKRSWLKSTLQDIQNHVAEEAASILQKNIRKKQIKQNKLAANKEFNLHQLNEQQVIIRKKLAQINQMKKTATNRKLRTYDNYKYVIKNNQQLRELTKKYRQFKHNLQEKTRIIEEKQQKDKLKLIKLKQQHLKTLCQQRKKKIQKAIQKIHKRKIKREHQLKLQKAKLKQLRRERLHEKMIKSFNKRINDSNQEKLKQYQKSKSRRIVNISSLSQHQKSYEQFRIDRQQKRTVKLAESRLLPEISLYKSRVAERIEAEQKKNKQFNKSRLQNAKLIRQKHKYYQERVRQDFAPTIKQRDSINEKQNRNSILDFESLKKKGNQYYRIGQRQTIPIQKRSQYQKNKILQQSLINKSKNYPNYLTQVLKNVTSHKRQPKNFDNQLKQIKKTIQDKKLSKADKLQQMRVVIQSMSYTYEPNKQFSEQQLINRLKMKLQLLSMLQSK